MHTFGATENQATQKNAQFSKSKVPCLIRHRGGIYYASAKVSGKIIRRSLDTDDFNTAKNLLPGTLEEMRGAKNARAAGTLGAAIKAESEREDPTIKTRTQHYYQETQGALERVALTMPENPLEKNISRVSLADLRALMDKIRRHVRSDTLQRLSGAHTAHLRAGGGVRSCRNQYRAVIETG